FDRHRGARELKNRGLLTSVELGLEVALTQLLVDPLRIFGGNTSHVSVGQLQFDVHPPGIRATLEQIRLGSRWWARHLGSVRIDRDGFVDAFQPVEQRLTLALVAGPVDLKHVEAAAALEDDSLLPRGRLYAFQVVGTGDPVGRK